MLTERQLQVLRLLADDLPRKQVAARLGISTETVKHHTLAILRKLGRDTVPGAVAEAFHRGLLVPSSRGTMLDRLDRLVLAALDLRGEAEDARP